ncbi:MAG: zinc-binding dehydrogenase, partial [Kiritimatiellia bacterium]|nr:zinc-binding dehydrogenase [Kiritimatiellia bacterium]
GAFQSVWNVKARTLCRVPASVPLPQAALIEPIAVACHDVRIGRVRKGETVVVLGGGPIGMLIAMVARAEGAKVLISEISPFRIEAARAAEFEVVNPQEQDLVAAVNERTGGAGADVVFEVTASAAAAQVMTDLVRTRGRIVVVGIYSQKPPVDLFRFFWREIELLGARLYESEDFEQAVALAASGVLPLGSLITGVYELENIQTAFESMENNQQAMKTLVRCSAE